MVTHNKRKSGVKTVSEKYFEKKEERHIEIISRIPNWFERHFGIPCVFVERCCCCFTYGNRFEFRLNA